MDWSTLCVGLLHLISEKLLDLSDFVRFRAVCKVWRDAVAFSDHSPQIPWLISRCIFSDNIILYKPSRDGFEKLTITGCSEASLIMGRLMGYLRMSCSHKESFLFNPLTQKKIHFHEIDLCCKSSCTGYNSSGILEHVATIGCIGNMVHLSFCRIGDQKWTTIRCQKWKTGLYDLLDSTFPCTSVYYNHKLFVLNPKSDTKIIDAATGAVMHTVQHPWFQRPYYAMSFQFCIDTSGYILGVSYYGSAENSYFEVYYLGDEDNNPEWIRTTDIGDRAVFWDPKNCICSRITNFYKFRKNCIYFPCRKVDYHTPNFSILCSYNIENGKVEKLDGQIDACSWFLPSLF
ncbi:F-box domain-containing protein [Rhynchospora pubera]|uniref:F-box domain-containing protein n=1 Tax=Rhynchospora pubera TaxID=906938 RepID=A0AAV8HWJ4_9POAL|nr:F-box domain-containing protein [Rhynchospora pubera]